MEFMGKMRKTLANVHKIKDKLLIQLKRRRYKRMILKEYWQMITDRCRLLQMRNQADQIVKFNGQKFATIPNKVRDAIIDQYI